MRLILRTSGLGILLALAAAMPAQPRGDNSIRVEITGLRNDQGHVVCALFGSAVDFPKKNQNAVARAQSEISNRHALCEFTAIEPGTYAISVFHDENSNGKLDTNLVGMPREGVGASNNARGHFGPPKFADAAFHFAGGVVNLRITISYL